MLTFMSDVTSWRRLTENAVEIGARRRGDRVRPLAAQRGEKGKRIGDEGGFAGLAAMRDGGEEGGVGIDEQPVLRQPFGGRLQVGGIPARQDPRVRVIAAEIDRPTAAIADMG